MSANRIGPLAAGTAAACARGTLWVAQPDPSKATPASRRAAQRREIMADARPAPSQAIHRSLAEGETRRRETPEIQSVSPDRRGDGGGRDLRVTAPFGT